MRRKKEPFSVQSADELQKVLFIQRSITRAAEKEMLVLAMENREPGRYLLAAKLLLEKYVSYPTLSEFASSPKLANVYKWGATFGVVALVGGLILEQAKSSNPAAAPVFRRMFLLLLREMDQAEHEDIIPYLRGELGMPMAAGDLLKAVEWLMAMSLAFGLVEREGEKALLTPTGKRVLLHLADAARFIEELGKAHAKFQSIKPKSSI